MVEQKKSLASIELKELITLGIKLDRICESAYFTLRYIQSHQNAKGSFFLTGTNEIEKLLAQLEKMRDLLPDGICNLESRTKDTTMTVVFGSDVETIYNRITQSGTIPPEDFIGRFKTNMDKLNKIGVSIKDYFQELQKSGMEQLAETVGQLILVNNLDDLNDILKSTVFTYQLDLATLKNQISDVTDLFKDTGPEKSRKGQIFSAGKMLSERQKGHQEMSALIYLTNEKLNLALHPGIAFEIIKNCIASFELHDELRHNPPGSRAIEHMLSFMKNQCTPEEFKKKMASINDYINQEMRKKIEEGGTKLKLNSEPYRIEDKYRDLIGKERAIKP